MCVDGVRLKFISILVPLCNVFDNIDDCDDKMADGNDDSDDELPVSFTLLLFQCRQCRRCSLWCSVDLSICLCFISLAAEFVIDSSKALISQQWL